MSNITLDLNSNTHVSVGIQGNVTVTPRFENKKKAFQMTAPLIAFNSPVLATASYEVNDFGLSQTTSENGDVNNIEIDLTFKNLFGFNAFIAGLKKISQLNMEKIHARNRSFKFQRADGKSIMFSTAFFGL